MNIRIISINKVKQSFILDGEKEYIKRLSTRHNIKLEELPVHTSESEKPEHIMNKEAEAILSRLKEKEYIIALDENGESFTSEKFAEKLQDIQLRGISDLVFVIGGAYGLGEPVKIRANLTLSLSAFTYTYQMSRLILIEQLYRCFSIIDGLPYHKA